MYKRARLFLLQGWLITLLGYSTVGAAVEDSDCLFDLNKAFAVNQEGSEALQAAQQHMDENHYVQADEAFNKSAELLNQAIAQYTALATENYDCSPSNLTIAKNNIRIAKESLQTIDESANGIDCLKELVPIEDLTVLASDYYHERNDSVSSKTAAQDALVLIKKLRDKNICLGGYKERLDSQQRYAEETITAIDARLDFEKCDQLYADILESESQARMSAFSNNRVRNKTAWQQVIQKTNQALQEPVCNNNYTRRFSNIKNTAELRLQHLQTTQN